VTKQIARLRRSLIATAVVYLQLTLIVGVSTPAVAAAITGPRTSSSSSDMLAGTLITLPDGEHRTLPKNWSKMSMQDMISIGIYPGLSVGKAKAAKLGTTLSTNQTAVIPTISTFVAAKALSKPMNAGAGQGDVQTYVWGSNGNVTAWDTNALWRGGAGATWSSWWGPPAQLIVVGTTVYPTGPGSLYSNAQFVPFHINKPTYLCVSWFQVSGKPCVAAH